MSAILSCFTLRKTLMKILVRNIARSVTVETINNLFSEFGTIQSCQLVMDKVTGQSKGFGFVEMPKIGEAKAAIIQLNGKDVEGTKLRVKKADPKPEEIQQTDD